MNLPKAIELNKEAVKSLKRGKLHDHADAVQLGIEALERLAFNRLNTIASSDALLPGETDEPDSP